jgi:hypothetical protein
MNHTTAMADRLPAIYREGELITGMLAHLADQVGFLDEDMMTVRREHWFERAVDLDDATALGDLLDLPAEPWMDVGTYRAWVDAIVQTTVRFGAVTPAAIKEITFQYVTRYQAATGDVVIQTLDQAPDGPARPTWDDGVGPALVEYPQVRRYGPDSDAVHPQPLQRFSLRNHGMNATPLALMLTGITDQPEACPLIAHLGASEAIVYLGTIRPGQRLWLSTTPDGSALTARLEGLEVTADVRTVTGFTPGRPWDSGEVIPARPLMLQPGDNSLWFLSVAVFDQPGLDRFLLSLADLKLTEGRFDDSVYDWALFSQEQRVRLGATWIETTPAAFSVRLPAGALQTAPPAGGADATAVAAAVGARDRLATSLTEAIGRFRASGVAADVQFQSFTETTRQFDALTGMLPMVEREGGPSGGDRLPDAGGTFGITRFEDSTFR